MLKTLAPFPLPHLLPIGLPRRNHPYGSSPCVSSFVFTPTFLMDVVSFFFPDFPSVHIPSFSTVRRPITSFPSVPPNGVTSQFLVTGIVSVYFILLCKQCSTQNVPQLNLTFFPKPAVVVLTRVLKFFDPPFIQMGEPDPLLST